MTTLAQYAESPTVKLFATGFPKTGKTGSLASLANAGFNLRILDFEGNFAPLVQFVDKDKWGNIEISPRLEDAIKRGSKHIETLGPPKAFTQGMDLLSRWEYVDKDGREVDLGPVVDWGPEDVLVLDSLTAMGKAAMRWVLFVQNRVEKGPRIQDWGMGQAAQLSIIEKLASESVRCNVVIISHLKMIGPPEAEKTDDDDVKETKRGLRDNIPYRYYPTALGRALPQDVLGYLPYSLLYEATVRSNKVKRQIITAPRGNFDLACPLPELEAKGALSIETGLAEIFKAAGVNGSEQKTSNPHQLTGQDSAGELRRAE